jgi:hypothetical protein
MPSHLVRVRFLVVAVGLMFVVCGCAPAAIAGWRQTLIHGILPAMVKRAAASLIARELYDLEEPDAPLPYGRTMRQMPTTDQRDPSEPRPEWRFVPPGNDAGPGSAVAARTHSSKQHSVISHLNYFASGQSASRFNDSRPEVRAFMRGDAGQLGFDQLVNAGVFTVDPLHGSVFKRDASVKYIILHSTETGSPADAKRVIQSWNNRGLRHPGAQFVVDRDGTIYSTTNPDMATVHINIHKTLPGYSNDNSVGIEIVRAGKQVYTQPQLNSVIYLVTYLQGHYHVDDGNVTTHHHVQPSDRSDPVGFDLAAFQSAKRSFAISAIAHSGEGVEAALTPSGQDRLSTGYGSKYANIAGTKNSTNTLKHSHHVAQMPQPAPDFRKN